MLVGNIRCLDPLPSVCNRYGDLSFWQLETVHPAIPQHSCQPDTVATAVMLLRTLDEMKISSGNTGVLHVRLRKTKLKWIDGLCWIEQLFGLPGRG